LLTAKFKRFVFLVSLHLFLFQENNLLPFLHPFKFLFICNLCLESKYHFQPRHDTIRSELKNYWWRKRSCFEESQSFPTDFEKTGFSSILSTFRRHLQDRCWSVNEVPDQSRFRFRFPDLRSAKYSGFRNILNSWSVVGHQIFEKYPNYY
jgi:hypothetical protein